MGSHLQEQKKPMATKMKLFLNKNKQILQRQNKRLNPLLETLNSGDENIPVAVVVVVVFYVVVFFMLLSAGF